MNECANCGTEHPAGRSIPRLGRLSEGEWREIAVKATDRAHCAEMQLQYLKPFAEGNKAVWEKNKGDSR